MFRCIVALVFAIGSVSGGAAGAATTCPHFAGSWKTDFGPMKLSAKPIKKKHGAYTVSGTYFYGGRYDRITGTLNGNSFFGRWIQPDRWGYLTLIESPDATGFGGTWTEANHEGGGRWNGDCAK